MSSKFTAIVSAVSLFACSTAYAATTANQNANQAALSQGAPAGVKKAESFVGAHPLLLLVGGGIIVGGVLLVATGNGHGASGTCVAPGCSPATTTTSTAP
jgi:hypothetical protein